MYSIFNNCARALARRLISRLRSLVELLLFFHTLSCGNYWCKIDGVYACTLLKISNSPFCVIPFQQCLFVLVFVCFFLSSKQMFFFLVLQFDVPQSNYMGKAEIWNSNEDMILALAGQFKQLSHEPEKFR